MAEDRLRRTGRTTRMLADAARLAREGRAVYVVAHERHWKDLRSTFERDNPDLGYSVHFETFMSLGTNLSTREMRLRGAHPNCVVLIDHYAIEDRLGALLEMLHRYDPKEG